MPIITCPNCGAKNRIDDRAESRQPVCGKCGQKLPTSATTASDTKPLTITDATFATAVLQSDKPVLLDCWAPWCGPCRMIAPIVDQLAAESAGRYLIAKLNTDENPAISTQFRIDAIPTMLLFHRGKLIDRIVGMQPKQALQARLDQIAHQPT